MTEDPEVVARRSRADLANRCVTGALSLMFTKDTYILDLGDQQLTLAYDLQAAAEDLARQDNDLRKQLLEIEDPDVPRVLAQTVVDQGFAGRPSDLLAELEVALAADSIVAYALLSPSVQDLDDQRKLLAERINP